MEQTEASAAPRAPGLKTAACTAALLLAVVILYIHLALPSGLRLCAAGSAAVLLAGALGLTCGMMLLEHEALRALAGKPGPLLACFPRLMREFSGQQSKMESLRSDFEDLRGRYDVVTTNIAASLIIYGTEGRVEYCSPYTQVLTGYLPSEVEAAGAEGRDLLETLVAEKDLERYIRARQVSRLGEDILVRYRIRHRSGLKLWLETRLVPVGDDAGEIPYILAVTVDVTDTLSYQEQIEVQNRDLSDFAYMVSHDLKAPIFTIKGMAAALMEDCGEQLPPESRELVTYMLSAADRLEKLVASVIEYSSINTKDWNDAEVELTNVLENVRADFGEQIRLKKAALTIEDRLPAVHGDPIRIYQIFSNLVGNALKYCSPGRAPEIRIRHRRGPGDATVIEVEDNGLGIPAARLGDIFRPYRRAHGGDIEGSGIGLACVKKIVDRLGGAVSVKSTEGEGSVFSVSLPPAAPKPREVPPDLARLF